MDTNQLQSLKLYTTGNKEIREYPHIEYDGCRYWLWAAPHMMVCHLKRHDKYSSDDIVEALNKVAECLSLNTSTFEGNNTPNKGGVFVT